MTEWIHESFVEPEKMLKTTISSFEAEVIVRWWLGLIAAHEGMRLIGWHSPTEYRQDAYASDRCDAFVNAGLLSENDLTALKAVVFKDVLEEQKRMEAEDSEADDDRPSDDTNA